MPDNICNYGQFIWSIGEFSFEMFESACNQWFAIKLGYLNFVFPLSSDITHMMSKCVISLASFGRDIEASFQVIGIFLYGSKGIVFSG